MPRFERVHVEHKDSPGDPQRDPAHHASGDPARHLSSSFGSNADADAAAAHIAELVRRTAEREAAPSPSCVARPGVTAAPQQPAILAPATAQPVARPPATAVAQPAGPPARPVLRPPSGKILIAGAAVAVLIGIGVTLSQSFDPVAAAPPASTLKTSAPAGYAVKVSDVITDCANHARGRTKASFEAQNCLSATRSVATGQVSGRPALFVVSRIRMPSSEAAASVKQVLDGSETGNLNDLLREGKTFPGAPGRMPASGYVSVQTEVTVTVAEAGFVDGSRSSSTNAALRAAAAKVAAMVSAES